MSQVLVLPLYPSRMARKTGRIPSSCAALLLLHLTCTLAAAVQVLDSIDDLQRVDFGRAVPLHSLLLLHWFANMVAMDNNGIMPLTFDPNADYGFHHYGNYERVLEPLPQGCRYYTVGNLRQGTASQLPDYVLDPQMGVEAENRDRIIIRVSGQRIDQVFITQHYDTVQQAGAPYDPARTYRVSSYLLRQIREFSLSDSNSPQLDIRNRYRSNNYPSFIKSAWGNLACLGLFLYIVLGDKLTGLHANIAPRSSHRPQSNTPPPSPPENSGAKTCGWVSYINSDDVIEEVSTATLPAAEPSSPPRTTGRRDWGFMCFLFLLLILFLIISILSIR